jgi:large subunit ribosomal protein L15
MQLHDVRKADLQHKKHLRIGRGPGSGIGKTSGRGLKGATARSGWTMKASYEGGQMPFFRRLPKRGFRNGPFRETFMVVNVGELSAFPAGSKVGVAELRAAGLLRGKARNPVKILGEGELKVALTVAADAFSQSALAKLAQAGGKAEWLGGTPKKPSPNFKKIEAEKKKAAAEKAEKAKPPAKGEGAPKGGGAPGDKPAQKPPKPAKKPEGDKPKPAPKAEGAGEQAKEEPKA